MCCHRHNTMIKWQLAKRQLELLLQDVNSQGDNWAGVCFLEGKAAVGQSWGEPSICWQLKCTPRLGSHRHTHCIHGAKEREALDIISTSPEQFPLALIPSKVWNPGFPLLNFVGWSFLVQTLSNYWCTEQQPQQTLQRFSEPLLKAKVHIPVHDLMQAPRHFRLGFLTKDHPGSGQKHNVNHHISAVWLH